MKTATTNKLIEATFKMLRILKENMHYTSSMAQMSMMQIQALVFIKQNPNVPMSKIAENLRIELPSATSLLNKLSELKLVERQTDPDDRRIVRINLTTAGQTLLKNAMMERTKKIEELLSFVSEEDQEALLRIVTILTEKLEK